MFWQVTLPDGKVTSFSGPEKAVAAIQAAGSGTVICFLLESNLNGGTDARSIAMWSLQEGQWCKHMILVSDNLTPPN